MEWTCYQTTNYELFVFEAEYGPFGVRVKSDNFSGLYVFCVERENLIEDLQELEKIHQNLEGKYKLCDMDSDSYIQFEMKKYGKLIVQGMIGGSYSDNYMVFGFEADQTLLINFINALKKTLQQNTR